MIEPGTKVRATIMNRNFKSSRTVDVIYEGHIVVGGDTFIFVTENNRRGTYGVNARYVFYFTPHTRASTMPSLDDGDTGERYKGFSVNYLREVYRSITNPTDRDGPIDVMIGADLWPAAHTAIARFAKAHAHVYLTGSLCRVSSPGRRDRKNKDWKPSGKHKPYPVPDGAGTPEGPAPDRFSARAQAGSEAPQKERQKPRRRRRSRAKSDIKNRKYPVMSSAAQERVARERIRKSPKRGRRRR